MKLPSSCQVLGRKVLIHRVEYLELDGLKCDAYWDGASQEIFIDADLDYKRAVENLFHELTHAHLALSGLSNLLKDDLEEAIASAMEGMTLSLKGLRFG